MGLPTWDKPQQPCLSSRIPYGTEVTQERLAQLARSEMALRALGLREFRVRYHGEIARIEVAEAEFDQLARVRAAAVLALKGGRVQVHHHRPGAVPLRTPQRSGGPGTAGSAERIELRGVDHFHQGEPRPGCPRTSPRPHPHRQLAQGRGRREPEGDRSEMPGQVANLVLAKCSRAHFEDAAVVQRPAVSGGAGRCSFAGEQSPDRCGSPSSPRSAARARSQSAAAVGRKLGRSYRYRFAIELLRAWNEGAALAHRNRRNRPEAASRRGPLAGHSAATRPARARVLLRPSARRRERRTASPTAPGWHPRARPGPSPCRAVSASRGTPPRHRRAGGRTSRSSRLWSGGHRAIEVVPADHPHGR